MSTQVSKVFILNHIVSILHDLSHQSLERSLSWRFGHSWPLMIGKSDDYPLVIAQLNYNRNGPIVFVVHPVPKPLFEHSHQMQDKLSVGLLSRFRHAFKLIDWLLKLHRYQFVFPQFKGKIQICSHFVFLRAQFYQFLNSNLIFLISYKNYSLKLLKRVVNNLNYHSKQQDQTKLFIKFIPLMDKLLSSRTNHDQELISVGNLSPEKYGRSAFYNLQYTPSKLADNVLFKEVINLKKIEEESSKNREFQAINDCLMDKLKYMQEQKNVIINSLNQQINVYKKIINQMESKNQQRIKQLQRKFKEELSKIITSKEEEVKFVQSEKELLENRIEELQREKQAMQQKIDSHNRSVSEQKSVYEKMEKQVQNLNLKLKEKSQQIKSIDQQNRKEVEDLRRKLADDEIMWKEELREALKRKQIEIQAMENSHRHEIAKHEELRKLQNESYKKETSDIIHSYEKELKKLSQLIANKERTIESLSRDYREEKNKNLALTKNYEADLGDLTSVKLLNSELERENQKLRELLIESSKQLQRCREEFLLIDKENSTLRIKLKSADEEARTWRQSYYMTKRA